MLPPLPTVRVVGPAVLARAMEALLTEKGVSVACGEEGAVLLLLPSSGSGGKKEPLVQKRVHPAKIKNAIRMANNLNGAEEWDACPPDVVVRALVSVEDPISCVLEALQAVSRNEAYCSPRLLPRLLDYLHQTHGTAHATALPPKIAGDEPLSFREKEVARAAAQGLSNAQIAGSLHISVATVKFHLSHVYQKLHLSRRSQISAVLPP